MSWWIMSASDRTIVALFLGTSFNGLLTVAHKFPSAYSAFYTVFNLSWTESASLHIGDDDAEEFFANVIHRVFRLFSSAAIGIVACMPFVFRILVNHSYADAYYQIPIYIIAAVCQMFQGLYSVIYVALKKTKEVAKSTIVAALINIIINISLIKIIGLYSASISTFIAYLFLCVWRYFDLKKYLNVKFDIKLLVSSIFIFAIICIGYYLGDTPIRIMCLIVAIMYSVYINRNILKLILQSPSKLKKIITSKK
jgi:O-antigen/teichoic acid export membrane protein